MLLIKANGSTIEQYPYSLGLLRKDNPNTSFPKQPRAELLASFGVYPVTELFPTVRDGQHLVKTWTPTRISNDWFLNHQPADLTDSEVAEATAVLAADAREKRDRLLAATDWTSMSDSPTQELRMVTYRQALRDISGQESFPDTIVWPQEDDV